MSDDLPPTRSYPAGAIVIEWREPLCEHCGHCARTLPRVFNPRRRPWVEPQHATEAEIIATVEGCPSGALRVRPVD